MNRTRWIIFAAVCAALLGLLVFTKPQNSANFEGDPAKVAEGDNVYGKADSKVVLIEYGDFQCPGCGSLYPTFKEVKEEYKDKVAFVFRDLPLTNIHPNAKAAAVSAAAAAEQGKFWEMHDKLFENQPEWSQASSGNRSAYFERYAKDVGLDMTQYKEDLQSDTVRDRVDRGLAAAKKAGLQLSTPILVLNGEKINLDSIQTDGRYDAGKLRSVLDKALKDAGLEPPKQAESDKNSQ